MFPLVCESPNNVPSKGHVKRVYIYDPPLLYAFLHYTYTQNLLGTSFKTHVNSLNPQCNQI